MDDGLGDALGSDGLNAMRALILHAYYGLRRTHAPETIGTAQIVAWIEAHEPEVTVPSMALVQRTLTDANIAHRAPGRPAAVSRAPLLATPRTEPAKPKSRRSARSFSRR